MGRHLAGLAAAGIALAGGAWLLLAPWVLGLPRPSGAWGTPMLTEFWSGAGLAAAAALAAVLHGTAMSAELRQAPAAPSRRSRGRAARHGRGAGTTGAPAGTPARMPAGGAEPGAPPGPAPSATAAAAAGEAPAAQPAAGGAPVAQTAERPEIDALLVPIATALLADLARRQGGGTGPDAPPPDAERSGSRPAAAPAVGEERR